MSKTEIDTLKLKQRPIVRLGIFLISHSLLFSVLCCTAGVFALFLLPILAKSTYISENALMPGSADPMLSNHEVSEANRLVKDVLASYSESRRASIVTQRLIAQYMSDLGAEVSIHKFHPQSVQFHPLSFFSNLDSSTLEQNISFSSYGVNTIGIVRAPRGDGKEAIVLVTPYNSVKISQAEAFSLGIAYSVFSLLTRVTWLAKDIIWLVADSHYGEYAAVAAWLRDYHTPAFTGPHTVDSETCLAADDQYEVKGNPYMNKSICYGFRRSGTMAAALVIKAVDKSEQFEDSLSLYAEASNGQMPNLDLINIVNYLAAHRQGFRVKVNKFWSVHEFKWLNILGELLESVGQVIRSLNPQWKFGIPAADYVDGAATLASSFYNQALGVPTGSHGAFRDYQVDAITLEISLKASLYNKNRQNEFLLRGGRLIEGVIRSVNNLLEKFHQSFFLYLLTSPSKFVSVGVYMIAFVLLVAPLPIAAASLYANNLHATERKDKPAPADEAAIILTSWKWINAAKKVFVVHFWGFVVLLLPYLICQIPHLNPTTSLIIWFSFSVFGLLVVYIILASSSHQSNADCFTTELLRNNRRLDLIASHFQIREWAILKSVTISAAFIGLCLMSVINFATAEIGGLLIVPMCLMAQPLRLDVKGRNLRSFSRLACNLAFAIVGFPPAAFILLKGIFEGFNGVNVGDFWNWLESLWAWSSATYLYIGMVHLPCWVLCIDILFHCC